jgi:hypothetical protein
MEKRKLDQAVEECIAADPVATRIAFDRLTLRFGMDINEFLDTCAKAFVLSNIFGESSIGPLLPELETMENGIYALDDIARDVFEELYEKIFGVKVEIE